MKIIVDFYFNDVMKHFITSMRLQYTYGKAIATHIFDHLVLKQRFISLRQYMVKHLTVCLYIYLIKKSQPYSRCDIGSGKGPLLFGQSNLKYNTKQTKEELAYNKTSSNRLSLVIIL